MAEVLHCLENNISVALATIVEARGSTPGEVGARMLVFSDGTIKGTVGGGPLEGKVIEEGLEVLKSSQTTLLSYELKEKEAAGLGMVCGGRVQVFVEPLLPQPHLVIAGGGHIAQSLCPFAKAIGYSVTVVDDREEFVNKEKFPTADHLKLGEIPEILNQTNIYPHTYIVIVTRGHTWDEESLHAVINSPAMYIGMIGSSRKVMRAFENLHKKGVHSAQLSRVKAPIGLRIGGNTPAEIALSILSQMQQTRYKTVEELDFPNPLITKLPT